MGEGTINPLMRSLQTDGLVESYQQESASGPSRKYYHLTEAGRSSLSIDILPGLKAGDSYSAQARH